MNNFAILSQLLNTVPDTSGANKAVRKFTEVWENLCLPGIQISEVLHLLPEASHLSSRVPTEVRSINDLNHILWALIDFSRAPELRVHVSGLANSLQNLVTAALLLPETKMTEDEFI